MKKMLYWLNDERCEFVIARGFLSIYTIQRNAHIRISEIETIIEQPAWGLTIYRRNGHGIEIEIQISNENMRQEAATTVADWVDDLLTEEMES